MARLKNFPHQYNDLGKVRRSLEIYQSLLGAGLDPGKNDLFGYALAEAQVYQFRNGPDVEPVHYDGSPSDVAVQISNRITQERKKPSSTQGACTAARELRSTLRSLGWIDVAGAVKSTGSSLLATSPFSSEERDVFRKSLMELRVDNAHPVRILMRLIDQFQFQSRSGMELALAAADDSVGEFAELGQLLKLTQAERGKALRATDTQIKNAVKILPAWLIQTGLIAQGPDNRYSLTKDGAIALKGSSDYSNSISPPIISKPVGSDGSPSLPVPVLPHELARHYENSKAKRILSPDEQVAAANLLLERTKNHQELVRTLGKLCGKADLYEDVAAYDLVRVPEQGDIILWEVKTVDGDETAQVRRAAEQLSFYEYFYVRRRWQNRPVRLAAVFDSELKKDLCDYLQYLNIGAFVLEAEALIPLNPEGTAIAGCIQLKK
jgi:hypothetical protein